MASPATQFGHDSHDRSRSYRRTGLAVLAMCAFASGAAAQMPDDGSMLRRGAVTVGVSYGADRWDDYWEGTRLRANGNVGSVTTRSLTATVAVGLTDRLTLAAALPYVWTEASDGVLSGMEGAQDATLAVQACLVETPVGRGAAAGGLFRVGAEASASAPASRYTPDFLPLSIGLGSRRASGRLGARFDADAGWSVGAAAAYTLRGNVTLNRDAYFTDGVLYLTGEVDMPDVAEYGVHAALRRGRVSVPVALVVQRTLGGGDIRRQDMPFVSNRMDFARLDASVAYAAPLPGAPVLRLGASRVLSGRNVGRSTAVTAGVLLRLNP